VPLLRPLADADIDDVLTLNQANLDAVSRMDEDRLGQLRAWADRGLGGFAYDELERVAAKYGRMTLEVNLVPRNDASLAFHARRGYDEVGRLGDQRYQVSMLEKTFR
jgi:predicted GNAT superfamily acetyltransferase